MAVEVVRFNADLVARPEGKFRALVCSFNITDKRGDIVRPGAFRASLDEWRRRNGRVPVVYSHQANDPHNLIGEISPHDSEETAKGLVASGRFYMDEPRAAKVYKQLERRALDQWSFSALVKQARDLPTGGRELLQLDLVEIGPTLVGVGDTATLEVASALAPSAPARPTSAELLAPHQARLEQARQRFARACGR